VVAGRVFTRRDNAAAPPVAVVNEVFVRRFFSGGNPIGRTFIAGPDNVPREVVGVVRDAKYNDLRQQALEMFYVPLEQWPASPPRSIQLRASGRQVVTTAQVAQALRDVDPAIVLLETKTLEEQMGRTFMRERLLADLSMFFAGVSLLVACLGLYSVLANQVLQRIREIGLRVALGSTLGAVVWMVVRDALLVVGIGVLAGIPLAIGLSNSLTPQLFGVTATDPFVFAAGVGLLLAVAVLAAVLPARAAATVDPVVALSAP
jgi:hypothetical protein